MTISAQQRDTVHILASGCCEYCRVGRGAQSLGFHVDHIIASSHGGDDNDENLCLACPDCNRFKGVNVAGYDPQTDKLSRLFHPRLDSWDEHFRVNPDASIIGLTPEGRTTVFVLRMNAASRIRQRFREYLLGSYPCQKKS